MKRRIEKDQPTAIITTIITVGVIFAGLIASYVTQTNDIKNLKDDVSEIKQLQTEQNAKLWEEVSAMRSEVRSMGNTLIEVKTIVSIDREDKKKEQ